MTSFQVRSADLSATRQKAIEDAQKMQMIVENECTKGGEGIPPYLLRELIGKGSYGRVYKADDLRFNKVVAVKIIDIEEGDTLDPVRADTYSEFLKEINALKLLRDSGAHNINHILDVLPVGHSMWMVTEHCAGGSVATLMRPTAPGGLQEKWIIPILREVAEAIYWVHKQDIIHRDIKCANVLVTEAGEVQLCDFGVAGVIENKFDKRSTFIGTPHWMAPELFDLAMDPGAAPSYGTEVDIWAFGSMVYEIASGLPPNVTAGLDITKLGQFLRTHTPRLEGDHYSGALKDLVAFCLEEEPSRRPKIEQVQLHPYIYATARSHPTASLSNLVKAFKLWEAQGGSRKSLFVSGGAQGPTDYSSTALANDEWNFSTTMDFEQQQLSNTDVQAVYDVYGSHIDIGFAEETSRPSKPTSRRRPPPQLPVVKAPLEKVFDPNTMSNYEDNARAYYGRAVPPPVSTSDLPLRDDSLHATLRESLIDLDASFYGEDLSRFVDMETIRAGPQTSTSDYDAEDVAGYYKPPLSDLAGAKENRKTQEWKFPTMAPPASANPNVPRFSFSDERSRAMSPGRGGRPPLVHHPTEPVGLLSQGCDLGMPHAASNRVSVGSLIDLDESLPTIPEPRRPSTSNSDMISVNGSDVGGVNPFDLERHASLNRAPSRNMMREPSIYVSDDHDFVRLSKSTEDTSAAPSSNYVKNSHYRRANMPNHDDTVVASSRYLDPEHAVVVSQQTPGLDQLQQDLVPRTRRQFRRRTGGMAELPRVPEPPSSRVMQGMATRDEIRNDVMRLLASFQEHLSFANAHLLSLPVGRARQESDGDMQGLRLS